MRRPVCPHAAREAITAVDATPHAVADYRRDGRRFVKVAGRAGHGPCRNGKAGTPPKGESHEE